MIWYEIKNLLKRFVVIYGFTMLATMVICTVFHPDMQLGIDYLWHMVVFSACADLPSLVCLRRGEQTEKEWKIREVFCAVLLELILMPLGYFFHMWSGIGGAVIFFLTILLVDLGVHLMDYGKDRAVANDLNRKLKERRYREERREREDRG
ncbi:MAG: hypothetical protein MR332_13800 [Fusicatenibacter sp.]|nr:hypothetical protein [Fusicatenibacter sp.]